MLVRKIRQLFGDINVYALVITVKTHVIQCSQECPGQRNVLELLEDFYFIPRQV
jgi:hypothetical protein